MAAHLELGLDLSGRWGKNGMAGLDCILAIRHPVGYGARYKSRTMKAHERLSYLGQGW